MRGTIDINTQRIGEMKAAAGAENMARSREELQVANAAARRREAEGKNPDRVLQGWANERQARTHMQEFFGDIVNPTRTQAKTAETNIREMSRMPFERMNPAQQAEMRKAALSALDGIPEFKPYKDELDRLGTTNAPLRDRMLNDALKNLDQFGEVGNALRKAHAEFFANPRAHSQEFTDATTALDGKKQDLVQNKEAQAANKQAQTENAAALADFDPLKNGVVGTKAYELDQAQIKVDDLFTNKILTNTLAQGIPLTDMKQFFVRKDQLDSDIASLTTVIRQGESTKNIQGQQLANLKTQLLRMNQAKALINLHGTEYDSLMQPVSTLTAEKTQLEQGAVRLTQVGTDLATEKTAIEKEIKSLQGKVNALTGKDQTAYAKAVENITTEAMKSLYESNLEALSGKSIEAINAQLEKEELAETDPAKKAFLRALRYKNVDRDRKGVIKEKTDKEKLSEHLDLLTTTDRIKLVESFINPATGKNYTKAEIAMAQLSDPTFYDQFGKTQPEAIMRHLLMSQENVATGENYTLQEINTLLTAHPDMNKEMIGKTVETLILEGVLSRKLSEDKLNIIDGQPWGGQELLQRILEKQEVKDQFKKWEEDPGTWGNLRKEMLKHKKAGLWMLLFLMFPSVGAIAGGVVLTKNLTSRGGGGGGEEHH